MHAHRAEWSAKANRIMVLSYSNQQETGNHNGKCHVMDNRGVRYINGKWETGNHNGNATPDLCVPQPQG